MAAKALESRFDDVVAAIAAIMKAHGFAKRGRVFRLLRDGNSAVVDFQRSRSSTGDLVRFTLNTGVICGALLDDYQPDVTKALSMDAHLRRRIGEFLPAPRDKWWDLTAKTDVSGPTAELCELLERAAIPYLLDHLDSRKLIALWESGRSPGLTEVQRQRYLAQLKSILAV